MNRVFSSNAFIGSLAFVVTLLFFHPIDRPGLKTVAQSMQMSTISLQQQGLKTPCLLSILPSSAITNLQGKVLLNGKIIDRLNTTEKNLDLSSQLKRGSNRLIITGKYFPMDSTVSIHLQGLNTEVNQQTGGNGLLNQMLVIEVD
ncbi:MAG: hypothetical protein DCF12_04355 [Snowella sp.]|jgi:hypothetical protein|nr:MAG: hypothetical protein DCF12_04355 [Snowella sp.]